MKRSFAILVTAGILLSGCDKFQNPAPPAPKVAAQPSIKFPRDQFSKLVMGQSGRDIKAKIGNPVLDNNYAGELGILWTYQNVTFDPATGRDDRFATIVFENGVVTKVIFK